VAEVVGFVTDPVTAGSGPAGQLQAGGRLSAR
jgi:hypothetical protein